jgi:hypothetical protein
LFCQVRLLSPRHTDTQTHRHTDTQTHRHTDTQTHRHTDTTHRHKLRVAQTLTHRHTDTESLRHRLAEKHIDNVWLLREESLCAWLPHI